MNYKINNSTVCLEKFTDFLVSFFENHLNTFCTGQSFYGFVEFFVCDYQDVINLLLENVLNDKNDIDKPIAVHFCHLKRFPVAGWLHPALVTDEKFNKIVKTYTNCLSCFSKKILVNLPRHTVVLFSLLHFITLRFNSLHFLCVLCCTS